MLTVLTHEVNDVENCLRKAHGIIWANAHMGTREKRDTWEHTRVSEHNVARHGSYDRIGIIGNNDMINPWMQHT